MVLDFFWDQNMRIPITLETIDRENLNLAHLCALLISLEPQGTNLEFWSDTGNLVLDHFWAQNVPTLIRFQNFPKIFTT